MADPKTFYCALPAGKRPSSPIAIKEKRVPGYQWYDDNRSRSRGPNPVSAVTTVVIHATAGWATQHALDNWRERQASAHWIIPDEDEDQHGKFVWAVVSESLGAIHVKNSATHSDIDNKTPVNKFSLGIEIVNTQDVQAYTDPYSDWQIEQAALLVRYAWAKYPNLKHVISHARLDPGRRGDPGSNFPWAKFKELVFSNANDVAPEPLMASVTPASRFPDIDPKKHGGCCP